MNASAYINVPGVIHSVDDNTRHWAYFRAIPRTAAEIQSSIHKSEYGGGSVPRDIHVHDGRQHQLKIDQASFELIDCPTKLSTSDFYAMQEGGDAGIKAKERYYAELVDVVKKTTGCDKVVCFHHQVRNQDKVGKDGVQGYAGIAPHTDSSPVSADQLAIEMAGEGESYERYAYINIWRNIADAPIQNDHLACLDERTTVKPDDYVTKDLFGDGFTATQFGLNARHVKAHKWYYFPRMKKDEAIIFKQMDSDYTKSGRICFHMSVNDPTAEAVASRQSIEVRMMCYWLKTKDGLDTMPTKENTNAALIKDAEEASKLEAAQPSFIIGILRKIPVLNWFVGPGTQGANAYTGSPDDYLDRFVTAINWFPSWPAFAKSWAKGVMKKHAKLEDGIAEITKALVDDAMGKQKTKSFENGQKKEIVDFLLSNESFLKAATKHLEKLA